MNPVYQKTGVTRSENGNCFQACLASVLNLSINDVPNFTEGMSNGAVFTLAARELLKSWLQGHKLAFVEFGFSLPLDALLAKMSEDFGSNFHYFLTGRTTDYRTHTVVCKQDGIVHDPATSPGHTVLTKPCHDGYFRVGLLVLAI